MNVLLVLLLVGLWGAVFLPPLLRARRHTSPIVSVSLFRRSMGALAERGSGRWVVMPSSPDQIRRASIRRRRRIFLALVFGSAMTLLIGLLPSVRVVLWAHVAFDLALGGYVYLLLLEKRTRDEGYTARHSATPPGSEIALEDEQLPHLQLVEHF